MRAHIIIKESVDLIRRLWSIQFFRYLVVGGINTIFGYTVFAIFILLQFHYAIATAFAVICSTLFNFKTHGVIVFRNKSNRLILRFSGVALTIYLLNIGLLKIFTLYNINSLIAQAIIILPLAATSFLLLRKFVFQSSSNLKGGTITGGKSGEDQF
jgi:putative flippase GtrA